MKIKKYKSDNVDFYIDPSLHTIQPLKDSFCDRQSDVIVTQIINLISLSEIKDLEQVNLIDYGCGNYGNLFFLLHHNKKSIVKKVSYFGLNYSNNFKIDDHRFKNVIKDYNNKNKSFEKVFMIINDGLTKLIKGNIVLLKNVLHEIELKNMCELLSNIQNLLDDRAYVIIYDINILYKGEHLKVPWLLDDSKFLFEEILKFEEILDVDYSVPDEFKYCNQKTSLNLYIGRKINNNDIVDEVNIKKKLLLLFKNKEKYFYEKKRAFDNFIRQTGKILKNQEEYIKYIFYCSNCTSQIKEAKIEWNL